MDLLEELDKTLLHYNGLDSKSKRVWDRLKWDEERSRILREKLTSTMIMLNTFYTSLIHDNQVLIFEALGRLEKDYRGGHREESIASVRKLASKEAEDDEEDSEDAAWSQIIRDLDDVGISSQVVLEYRDLIVDWFIDAINSGRLEEQANSRSLSALSHDLSNTLPIPTDETRQCGPAGEIIRVPPPAPEMIPPPVPPLEAPGHLPSSPSFDTIPIQDNYQEQIPVDTKQSAPVHDLLEKPLQDYGTLEGNFIDYAQHILASWEERDFATAESFLEKELAAVERGETVTIQGGTGQPDRRVLLHLLGVCASYSGDFLRAKRLFIEAFNGIYLSGGNIDDGDIAAARWLGDACLHLNEPHNTAFCWGVALEGLVVRYGTAHSITWRVYEELYLLDHVLNSLKVVAHSFRRNFDPTDIFLNSHAKEKANLMVSVVSRMEKITCPASELDSTHIHTEGTSTVMELKPRPRTNSNIAETHLTEPMLSSRAWPLQWDPTFSPRDAIILQQSMASQRRNTGMASPRDIFLENLPSVGLVHSKLLHYVTKRDIKWLLESVEAGLRELGIEYQYGEHCTLTCRLNQRVDNFAFFEGIRIKFKKIQFRSMYGLKITSVLWATRQIPTRGNGFQGTQPRNSTEEFRSIIRGILASAEEEEILSESPLKTKLSWKSSKSRSPL